MHQLKKLKDYQNSKVYLYKIIYLLLTLLHFQT
jgi:hypothetical protein